MGFRVARFLAVAALLALCAGDEGDRCLTGSAIFPFMKLKHVEVPVKRGSQNLGVFWEARGLKMRCFRSRAHRRSPTIAWLRCV